MFYQGEEFQLIYFVIIYFTVTMIIRYTCSFPECNVKSLNFIFSSLHVSFSISNLIVLKIYNLCYRE